MEISTPAPRRLGARLLLLWFVLLIAIAQAGPAQAQQRAASAASSSGMRMSICEPPPTCFADKAAKEAWAAGHNCRFIEDVCEKTSQADDNKGADPADHGFWDSMWDVVKDGVTVGYEFVKGFWEGLKQQVTDLWDMVADPIETAKGLIELAKAFYNDFEGTAKAIGEALGQDLLKLAECGAYDRGKVIGNYVSPGFMLKLTSKLAKFKTLTKALEETKKDFGCASFAAGTLVWTGSDLVPIETVRRGAAVASRNATSYLDATQPVAQTFERVAPTHRLVETEKDAFVVTDEHPFWVQGVGWVPVRDIKAGTAVATATGDTLILSNVAIDEPAKVYNFSVAQTESYFVGSERVWVHNAACDLDAIRRRYENPYDTQVPREGSGGGWSDQRGNSEWRPEPGTPLYEATGGKPVVFKDGYPDFSPFAYETGGKKAVVPVDGLKGNTSSDFTKADQAYREAIGDPDWKRPDDYTWHHHEDCKTMILVPKDVNNKVPHSGGASNIKNGTC